MKLDYILVGRIVNAHGIRGEVRVQPRDGDPRFLTRFHTFYMDGRPVTPSASHVHKSFLLLKLPGVEDMNAALDLKGKDLYIRREDARLPEGQWFDDELLGLAVVDEAGAPLGELTADAFRWAAAELAGEGTEVPTVALTAAGVLRAPLPKGELTTAQVFEVLCVGSGADGSAGSPLVSCYLTGKELRAAMEVDASIAPLMPEAQLYFSGADYSFNTHRMFLNKVTGARLTQTGEKPESGQLYRVVTSLYCGQMLSAVKDRSLGLLSIVPKDENGEPIADLESRILRDPSGHEIKEWYALAAYLQSFGQDGVPTSYAWPDGRKEVSRSWNPIELIKSPSLLTVGVLLLGALAIAAAVFLVRSLIRRRRSGRYGGYRRRRFFQ